MYNRYFTTRTVSRGMSLRWSYFSLLRSPSTPKRSRRGQPGRASVHGLRRILLRAAKRHTALRHCQNILAFNRHEGLVGSVPRLCGPLHYRRNLLREYARCRVLSVDLPISLCTLARFGDKDAKVGTHSRVHDPNVGAYHGDLFQHRIVDQDRR
jgi:hypothetical protein